MLKGAGRVVLRLRERKLNPHLKAMCKGKAREGKVRPPVRGHNYIVSSDSDFESDLYNLNVRNENDRPFNLCVNVNGKTMSFELDTGTRRLALALRKPEELELRRLEAEGAIRKVEYSDYGTPIVPLIKKSGEIRICGDNKVTINPKLIRDPYPCLESKSCLLN
ncbi:unnamed protein product [Arctia plantaginis]|uniref:Uncharacterized protein n=1 Tax=Arctia plantaginis TaxID=874455 RepID=A0A8S1B6C9_ARCPL|nr:unnamed protein product [Arctia plantaginis]